MNKIYIAPAVMKELSRQILAQSLLRIAFDWAVIIATTMLVQAHFHWALYILAVMVIANRQHGLLIMMHDAARFSFHEK